MGNCFDCVHYRVIITRKWGWKDLCRVSKFEPGIKSLYELYAECGDVEYFVN